MRRGLLLSVVALVAVVPAAGALPLGLDAPSASQAGAERTPRPPIVVTDDSQFTLAQGVVRGDGTEANPYVISGWQIDGGLWAPRQPVLPSSPFPPGIFIQGTDSHVVIRDNHVLDNPRAQIMVRDAKHVTIEENVLERTPTAPRRVPFDDVVTLIDVQDVTVRRNTLTLAGSPQGANGIIAVSEVRENQVLDDVAIRDNEFVNTGSYGGRLHGILVDGGSDVDVAGNFLRNQGDVAHYQALEVRNLTNAAVRRNVALEPGPADVSEGILAASLDNTVVAQNKLGSQDVGILSDGSFDTTFRSNQVQDHADVGMAVRGGDDLLLDDNQIESSGLGLRLDRTSDVTARDNTLAGNDRGMSVLGSTFTHHAHDIALSNTIEGKPVRYLTGPDGVTLDGANMEAGYLALVGASDTVLNGTPDLPSNGQGLLVAGGRNVTVDVGTLSGHGTSLNVVQGREHTISNLTATDARILSSPLPVVENSTLRSSDGDGLVVGPASQDARLRNLTLTGHAGDGLYVNRSTGTEAEAVVVDDNGVGVRVVESDSATVNGSSIAGNTEAGLVAEDAFGAWTVVDATDNWWGATDGPSTFGGSGDAVVEGDGTNVVVNPFLESPPDAGDPSPD